MSLVTPAETQTFSVTKQEERMLLTFTVFASECLIKFLDQPLSVAHRKWGVADTSAWLSSYDSLNANLLLTGNDVRAIQPEDTRRQTRHKKKSFFCFLTLKLTETEDK